MTGECCRGQIMCKPCLDEYARSIAPSACICPVCRKEGLATYPNFQLDREIRCLHVYCINKERGCEWQGEVNYVKDHLINSNGCQFYKVECTNNCGQMIERRNLATHTDTECPRRKVNCEYCYNITLEYQLMELLHINKCPKFPIPCPNKCNVGTIPREDFEKHKGECQLEVIECSSKCGSKLERQNLPVHLEHACPCRMVSCQYCHNFGEYWFIDGKHVDDCFKFPLPCPNKCSSVPREDLKAHGNICPLQEIECEYHTVGCKIKFARKDEVKHMKEMVGAHLMMVTHKLSKVDGTQQELTDLKVKLTSTLNNSRDELAETKRELKDTKVELKNTKTTLQGSLRDAREKLDQTKYELSDTKCELRKTKDEVAILKRSLSDAKDQLATTSMQIANLMVLLHAQMKPVNAMDIVSEAKPSVTLNAMGALFKFGDRVCPVVIKMSEFKKKQKENVQWYSDPFFTHTQGYKMRLSIVPAGIEDGKGTHLSVYLFLMRGPHDDTLKWPLKETLEIKLLNQIGDSDHHSKMITFEAQNNGVSRGKGQTQFIPNKDLGVTATNYQYLKDNCVFFQVTKL